MQEFIIQLPHDYCIPQNINKLVPKEWQSILEFINGTIILGIAQGNSETHINEAIAALERKHIEELKNAALAKETLENTYNRDKTEYNAVKNAELKAKESIIETLTEQIKKLNEDASFVFTKKIAPLYEQINDMRSNIANTLVEEKRKLEAAHAEDISLLEAKYEARSEKRIKEITSIYEKQLEDNKNNIRELKTHINGLADNSDIMKKLDPIVKFYDGNNSEKGSLGEAAIGSILSDSYQDAIIEDVSSQTAAGDIIFTWKRMKCLIEIKNKSRLTKDDIDKFLRDVVQCTDTSKVNCAIFISLRTDKFPGKTREFLQLEYHNGTPIIYAYMPPPTKELPYAILCLDKIIGVNNQDCQEELQQHFINYFNHIILYKDYFDAELRKKQREVKAILRHLEKHNALCSQLEPIYSKIAISVDNIRKKKESNIDKTESNIDKTESNIDKTESNIDKTESKIKIYEKQLGDNRNNISRGDVINATSSIIKDTRDHVNGSKNNIKSSKYEELYGFITRDKIDKIIVFQKNNKRDPTRKELIANDILKEYTFKKVNKLFSGKNALSIILEFVLLNNDAFDT
jgi:hypothetical protein